MFETHTEYTRGHFQRFDCISLMAFTSIHLKKTRFWAKKHLKLKKKSFWANILVTKKISVLQSPLAALYFPSPNICYASQHQKNVCSVLFGLVFCVQFLQIDVPNIIFAIYHSSKLFWQFAIPDNQTTLIPNYHAKSPF